MSIKRDSESLNNQFLAALDAAIMTRRPELLRALAPQVDQHGLYLSGENATAVVGALCNMTERLAEVDRIIRMSNHLAEKVRQLAAQSNSLEDSFSAWLCELESKL